MYLVAAGVIICLRSLTFQTLCHICLNNNPNKYRNMDGPDAKGETIVSHAVSLNTKSVKYMLISTLSLYMHFF